MAVVAWPPPTPPNTRANVTAELDAHPSDHNRIADALDTLIARATPSAWVTMTLSNGWLVFDANAEPLAYRKIGDVVYLRGLIKGGTGNATIATLPVGFRPPKQLLFPSISSDGGANRVTINTDGTLSSVAGNPVYLPMNYVFTVTP